MARTKAIVGPGKPPLPRGNKLKARRVRAPSVRTLTVPPPLPPLPHLPPHAFVDVDTGLIHVQPAHGGQPHHAPGIRRALAAALWPHYSHAIARQRARPGRSGSCVAEGLRVEAGIAAHMAALRDGTPAPPLRHRYERAFVDWATQAGLTFAGAQLPLYDPTTGIATRIDLLLYDAAAHAAGRAPYVLAELKTGLAEPDLAQGRMRSAAGDPALSAWACTPRNQAYAQLAWMRAVAREHHGFDVRGVLAILNDRTIKLKRGPVRELPPAIAALEGALMHAVALQTEAEARMRGAH